MALLRVNPPCPVLFEGWETTTEALGRRGWRISLEEEYRPYDFASEKRLLLYHDKSNLKMLAVSREYREYMERDRYNSFQHQYMQEWNGPTFNVVHVANDFVFKYDTCMPQFIEWGETRPRTIEMHEQDIMMTPLFLKLKEAEAKEIIVEPQEVSQLLEQIMRMQSPGQAEIRKRNRLITPQVHASILTFPGAA
jgi:hypothetical protein